VSLFALPSPLGRPPIAASSTKPFGLEAASVPAANGPVVAVADAELCAAVRRIADLVAVEVQQVDVEVLEAHWSRPRLVVVDVTVASQLAGRGVTRRSGVVVVSAGDDDPGPWRVAVEIGADHVAQLPEAEPWLADRLSDGDAVTRAPVVAVVGGCGGAGASTLAAALAFAAGRAGRRSMLIDLDPIGAGLDVLLGGDDAVGARWEDLSDARGRVDGAALRSVLPSPASVPVVTWRRDQPGGASPSHAVFAAVLEAGRRANDVVVVDVPRRLPVEPDLLSRIHRLVVVTPARVRAALAAGRLIAGVNVPTHQVSLVVRGPAPAGLSGNDVAAACGVDHWVWLDPEARRDEQEEHGVPPATSARGPLAQCCQVLLDDLSATDRVA